MDDQLNFEIFSGLSAEALAKVDDQLNFEIFSGLSAEASAKVDDQLNFEIFSGDHSVGETPVPIPNTAVKTHSADDTAYAGK